MNLDIGKKDERVNIKKYSTKKGVKLLCIYHTINLLPDAYYSVQQKKVEEDSFKAYPRFFYPDWEKFQDKLPCISNPKRWKNPGWKYKFLENKIKEGEKKRPFFYTHEDN